MEHRLTREQPGDADAVEAADQFVVAIHLDRVGPSELVEVGVGIDERLVDPEAGPVGVGARLHDVAEPLVHTHVESPETLAERA